MPWARRKNIFKKPKKLNQDKKLKQHCFQIGLVAQTIEHRFGKLKVAG